MKKKILAVFLSLCMAMSLLPVTALAAEGDESTNATAITTQKELQNALTAAASTQGTVTLTSDITVLDTGLSGYGSAAIVVPEGVTLNGAGHTIKAETWTPANRYHVIGVMNTKANTTTTIENLTIVGNANTKSGIHAYNCEGTVNLTDVTIRNCGNAAVQVNGSKVTATGLTTSDNAWGAVNVDKGSTGKIPSFTLSGEDNNLTEPTKIWTELTPTESDSIITVPGKWTLKKFKSVDGKTYWADTSSIRVGSNYYPTLQDAVKAIQDSTTEKTITLEGNVTVTQVGSLTANQAAVTLPTGVTLDGQGNQIIAIADWDKTKNNHILGVVSPTDDVTIKDVTIVGNTNTKHGINAYGTNNPGGKLVVDNVTIKNCGTAGMVVNGMTVEADRLTTSGNVWGAVNVDKADCSKLTLTNANLAEDIQVWTEKTEVSDDTISIEGTGFTMVTGAGKTTDTSGLKGFTYYTTDLSKLGEASITTDGKTTVYATLAEAINAAQDGNTVTLLKDVTVSDDSKGNTQGILTITKNITLDGNGKTITSGQSTPESQKASVINVEGTKNVTIKNLTIDSAQKAKHGLNLYNAGQVNVENVTIKNGTGYGVVCSSSTLNATNLNTRGNSWGGINIDTKVDGVGSAFSMTSGTIQEKNSVYIENAQDEKISANIYGGTFQNVSISDGAKTAADLTIYGGSFKNNVTDYLADGLVQNADGSVGKPYIPPANPNYRIDIPAAEGGTVTADPAAAKAGATVTLTATPDEGYAVGTITVTDRFGDAVKVTENADGTYTFTMPNGQVTVKATFVETEEPAPAEPFPDVDENDWFYDEVVYVYENGLMNGVENNQFAPNTATNRAMLATILYRLAGQPDVSGDLPFTDVAAGTWYTDAVLWAAQNGIVNGLGENTFAPMNTLTREQLVTMLYRYAEAAGYDVSAAADLSGYPDAGKVQPYAQEAMSWAVAEGIVEGMDGNLNPAGSATRAQIATILMRFCEGVAK